MTSCHQATGAFRPKEPFVSQQLDVSDGSTTEVARQVTAHIRPPRLLASKLGHRSAPSIAAGIGRARPVAQQMIGAGFGQPDFSRATHHLAYVRVRAR